MAIPMTANHVLLFHASGMLTKDEADAALERLDVRGAWDTDGSFLGYDYFNQKWIETDAATINAKAAAMLAHADIRDPNAHI